MKSRPAAFSAALLALLFISLLAIGVFSRFQPVADATADELVGEAKYCSSCEGPASCCLAAQQAADDADCYRSSAEAGPATLSEEDAAELQEVKRRMRLNLFEGTLLESVELASPGDLQSTLMQDRQGRSDESPRSSRRASAATSRKAAEELDDVAQLLEAEQDIHHAAQIRAIAERLRTQASETTMGNESVAVPEWLPAADHPIYALPDSSFSSEILRLRPPTEAPAKEQDTDEQALNDTTMVDQVDLPEIGADAPQIQFGRPVFDVPSHRNIWRRSDEMPSFSNFLAADA